MRDSNRETIMEPAAMSKEELDHLLEHGSCKEKDCKFCK